MKGDKYLLEDFIIFVAVTVFLIFCLVCIAG